MRKLLLLLLTLQFINLQAQDYLTTPRSNPALFNNVSLQKSGNIDKVAGDEVLDSVVYAFDTLDLPFIDDFSRDHFYRNIASMPSSNYSDTMFYKILVSGNVYRSTAGLVTDTTFTYQLNANGGTISKQSNFAGIVKVFDFFSYPVSSEMVDVYKPFDIYDSLNGNSDTTDVDPTLFQDSARYYFVAADSSVFYTDRKVYRNNHFPISPPSIGVATFDGLDENGLPYDIYNALTVKADYLTSVPLRMGNLPDTNVYISFFVQPKGLSITGPKKEDSLALDFYNPTDNNWGTIWAVEGYSADTFKQHIVKVPNQFLKDGTQFRFRAYANSTGAFNQWHLDYIYMDASRNPDDTTYTDIAYVYEPHSLLKDYQAMPYWHFASNPGQYMIDSSGAILVKNNGKNGASVYNKVVIPDTVNNTEYYRYPASPQLSILQPAEVFEFDYPINFNYAAADVDSAGTFAAEYTIRNASLGSGSSEFIPSNDTVYSTAILDNYYAYDDGTAEAGYGVNPDESPSGYSAYMAVEFNQTAVDTIGGVQIYFLPQNQDIRSQVFRIKVWAGAQNAGPGDVIYTKEESFNPMYTNPNGFITFWFDTLILVPQRYYVGIEAVGKYSMNIGYDLNNNSRDKIFWSFEGDDWYSPTAGIFDGSLMIRPIYHKSYWGVGLEENSMRNSDIMIYPNPNIGRFSIELKSDLRAKQLSLYNIEGKQVYTAPFHSNVDVQRLPKGLYFVRILMEDGSLINKKIILQ